MTANPLSRLSQRLNELAAEVERGNSLEDMQRVIVKLDSFLAQLHHHSNGSTVDSEDPRRPQDIPTDPGAVGPLDQPS